jgi:hypothetical protein
MPGASSNREGLGYCTRRSSSHGLLSRCFAILSASESRPSRNAPRIERLSVCR